MNWIRVTSFPHVLDVFIHFFRNIKVLNSFKSKVNELSPNGKTSTCVYQNEYSSELVNIDWRYWYLLIIWLLLIGNNCPFIEMEYLWAHHICELIIFELIGKKNKNQLVSVLTNVLFFFLFADMKIDHIFQFGYPVPQVRQSQVILWRNRLFLTFTWIVENQWQIIEQFAIRHHQV